MADLDPRVFDPRYPWQYSGPPLPEARKPRRARRLSFAQARKEGGPIASVTDHGDGARTYRFGPPTSGPDGDLTEWDIELGKSAPPQTRQ